ncbi:MAG TPA: EAL domain-containing protein [Usitatibacter sp.]|nr:EAL domain-containing protein [Usitatibacter sp.]
MAQSLSRVAEGLVRSSRGESLQWQGKTLATHFQPIYSVHKAGCIGFEALVRATDAEGDPIRPGKLFAQAFSDGDGNLLDWICRALHLRKFATVDPGDRTLYLNVHPEAVVKDARSSHELAELVRFYGLSPERVCVEILESSCADEGLLREAVAAYRSLGASIAMDDFGIGRSNFDRIVRLRPDLVKIDRSVLIDAVGDRKSRLMLPSIVELLHEAGAEVAVEGIESGNEALLAMDSGADLLQGFHFAPPSATLPDDALTRRILTELLRMRGTRLSAVGVS